jgi:oligopeptide/dipeptide ABC transporter ATP-binding protein
VIEADGIFWKGENLLELGEARMRSVRGKEIAMIFQDPLTALNPVHTVGRQIGEMVRIHEHVNRRTARERSIEMLHLVGIPRPEERVDHHPHEFSGGMRQRVMIAMAIACRPDLLIADEPTTALDVTVQAQVFETLMSIKDEIDSAMILITHDLGIVAGIADRSLVMYAGRAVEVGTTDEVFYESRHPYTLGLLSSLPRLDDVDRKQLRPIRGAPPSLIHRPTGCSFHPRCDYAQANCSTDDPPLREVAAGGHLSACHYAEVLDTLTPAVEPGVAS